MRRRSFTTTGQGDEGINISPLIDMVFILLIFFIVTTVFVEETGVEVNKPEAASAQQLEKNSVLIAITSNGKVVYGGQEIGKSGVPRVIRDNLRDNPEMPVIIQADEQVNMKLFADVFDAAKLAGATRINFATER